MTLIKTVDNDLTLEEMDLSDAEIKAQKVQLKSSKDGHFQFSNANIQSSTGCIEIDGLDVSNLIVKRYLKLIGIKVIKDPDSKKITLQGEKKSIILTPLEVRKIKEVVAKETNGWYSEDLHAYYSVTARQYDPGIPWGIVASSVAGGLCIVQKTALYFNRLGIDCLYRIDNGRFTLNSVSIFDPDFQTFLKQKGCEFYRVDNLLIFAANNLTLTCQEIADFKNRDPMQELIRVKALSENGGDLTDAERREADEESKLLKKEEFQMGEGDRKLIAADYERRQRERDAEYEREREAHSTRTRSAVPEASNALARDPDEDEAFMASLFRK